MNELQADDTIHNTMNKWTPSKEKSLRHSIVEFCCLPDFFLMSKSHITPIQSIPANTPSKMYRSILTKPEESSNKLNCPAGLLLVYCQKRKHS